MAPRASEAEKFLLSKIVTSGTCPSSAGLGRLSACINVV